MRVAILISARPIFAVERTINDWIIENSPDELHDILIKDSMSPNHCQVFIIFTNRQQEQDEIEEKEAAEERAREEAAKKEVKA